MKLQFVINPKMKEALKQYSEKEGLTMTSTIHLALSHLINSSAFDNKLKKSLMKKNNETKNIGRTIRTV